jgi:alanine racemase
MIVTCSIHTVELITRPTRAEINLDALEHNFTNIRKRTGKEVKILTVVKANAYGHGAIEISHALQELGVDFLGVATCEEGIELRKASITTPIILLGGSFTGQATAVLQHDLIPVVYNIESAKELSQQAHRSNRRVKIHVKIDTGMGRLGVLPPATNHFFHNLTKLHGLEIEGILTHLADTNQDNHSGVDFTRRQVALFNQQIEELHNMGIHPHYKHLANSAAIIGKQLDTFNLVRPGIMLYGAYPAKILQQMIELQPVMSLKTKIIALKTVPEGTSISYGRTFTCTRESLIATLPIGYADGYSRSLSNRAEVLIRGRRAPVVGVVCMDMVMVDATEIAGVSLGDDAVLMGSQAQESITAEDIAEKMGSIAYEFLCGIGPRVPRIYRKGDTMK